MVFEGREAGDDPALAPCTRSPALRRGRSEDRAPQRLERCSYPANVAKVQWFPSGSATVKSRDG